MTNRAMTSLALVCLLGLPGALRAQEEGMPHRMGQQPQTSHRAWMGQGPMMGGHGMRAGSMPRMILIQKEALGLNDQQVERLEALHEQAAEARQAHVTAVAPLREQAWAALHAEDPDLAKYESTLKQLADQRVQMQLGMARLAQQATEVLTAQQRSNVRYALRVMRGMRGGAAMRGGMMHGGMMHGGMMGGGMMRPDCPWIEEPDDD